MHTFPELEFLMDRNVRQTKAGSVFRRIQLQFLDAFCSVSVAISLLRASICSALSGVTGFFLSLLLDLARFLISGVEFGL